MTERPQTLGGVDTVISYTKLRSGGWGVRGPASDVRESAIVTVTKRDGTSKQETVSRVLWSGDGIAIASIRTSASGSYGGPGSGAGYNRYECEDCEVNGDMGDMAGCPRHRGSPRC